MKAIRIDKAHDISAFASTDETRHILNSIHFHREKKRLEATDGNMLVTIPVEETEDFPEDTFTADAADAPDAIIPLGAVVKALKNAPAQPTSPILGSVALTGRNGKVTLTSNDFYTVQRVEVRPIDGEYPNLDRVTPKPDESWVTVALSGALLGKVCDYAKRHATNGHSQIIFRIKDDVSGVTFRIHTEAGDLDGVLMPLRIS